MRKNSIKNTRVNAEVHKELASRHIIDHKVKQEKMI